MLDECDETQKREICLANYYIKKVQLWRTMRKKFASFPDTSLRFILACDDEVERNEIYLYDFFQRKQRGLPRDIRQQIRSVLSLKREGKGKSKRLGGKKVEV